MKRPNDPRRLASLRTVTTIVYALQAAAFLVGITSVVALIIDYVKRPDAEDTYLASHFTWQIRVITSYSIHYTKLYERRRWW